MPITITPITIAGELVTLTFLLVVVYYGLRVRTEAKYTAAHELGHALACKYYGVPVSKVVLNQYGTGGYTTFDIPHSTKQHLVIIAAGYVAEETAKGHVLGTALRGGQYEGDYNIARALVGDDEIAVALAIRRATEVLSTPRVAEAMEATIPVLIKKSEISGAEIQL